VDLDLAGPDDAAATAVLLHPHPQYGGDRFHPLISGLFRRLPGEGYAAARFDFLGADRDGAHGQVRSAIDAVALRWPGRPVLLVGYSFGAGVAAGVDDQRIAGWFLVAPQTALLAESSIGADPRPKAVVVPDHDQFSPPERVASATRAWTATTTQIVPGDHFLAGAVDLIVAACTRWVASTVRAP
jgi:uncharacterized protein